MNFNTIKWSYSLREQLGLLECHRPAEPQIIIEAPTSVYPVLHVNVTADPYVYLEPYLTPLGGVPGSPQAKVKCKIWYFFIFVFNLVC